MSFGMHRRSIMCNGLTFGEPETILNIRVGVYPRRVGWRVCAGLKT